MENNVFEVKDLCFAYSEDTPILRHLDFGIKEGKITTIMGANGCGKSTLFQLLTKNLVPNIGQINLRNKDIDNIELKNYAKKVAIVNQYNNAPDDLKVKELVEYGRTPYQSFKTDKKELEYGAKKVEQAMKITGVYQFKDRTVNSLSGGQKQRVWIAMAIAQGTKILFLDEPTTYLDVKYQLQILRLVKALNEKFKMTIVMVLHDINQALVYSDEIIALSQRGTIIAKGKPEEVINTQVIDKMYGINLEAIEVKGKPFILTV